MSGRDCLPEFEHLNVPLKIGVLGDTHRSSRNPRALPIGMLRTLETCDIIFHTGDVNAPWVLRELEKLGPVRAVRGNNEEPPLSRDLPLELYFRAGNVRIGLMHGHHLGKTARQNTLAHMGGVVDLAIYGHSHVPEIAEHSGLLMVNPGSPTQRRYQPEHTFAMVTITGDDEIDAQLITLVT